MKKHAEDFKQEAVGIALTSGLSQRRVAVDLGVGLSTLGKWVSQYRPSDLTAQPQANLAQDNGGPWACANLRVVTPFRDDPD